LRGRGAEPHSAKKGNETLLEKAFTEKRFAEMKELKK